MAKKFTSPKGQASFPALVKADTRYNPEGIYKTGLIVSAEQAEKMIELFQEVFTDEFGTKKKLSQAQMPYKVNDDGTITVQFKSKNKPTLVDAKGNPVKPTADLKIGGGSTIKVNANAKAYNTGGAVGVTCYLNAVQIIELVEYNSTGFGVEEGGFSAADLPDAEEAPAKLAEVDEEDVAF